MKQFKILISLCFMSLLVSCDLIFDTDLEKESIVLISPGENEQNDSETQFFFWEENEDIDAYRLQIASPSFDSPSEFFFDTLTDQNSYKVSLDPLSYQWRVRGENSVENKSPYTTRSLQVDTLKDIRNITVELLTPSAGQPFKEGNQISLAWENIEFTNKYFVFVESTDASRPASFIDSTTSTTYTVPLSLLYQFDDEMNEKHVDIQYKWNVRAFVTEDNQSKTSLDRTFTVEAIEITNP